MSIRRKHYVNYVLTETIAGKALLSGCFSRLSPVDPELFNVFICGVKSLLISSLMMWKPEDQYKQSQSTDTKQSRVLCKLCVASGTYITQRETNTAICFCMPSVLVSGCSWTNTVRHLWYDGASCGREQEFWEGLTTQCGSSTECEDSVVTKKILWEIVHCYFATWLAPMWLLLD